MTTTSFSTTIPAADFRTIYSTNIELLPVLTANEYYSIDLGSISWFKAEGTAPYDFGGGVAYLGYTDNQGEAIVGVPDASFNTFEPLLLMGSNNSSVQSNTFLGQPIILFDNLQDATQGDGDVTISFEYSIVDISL